jgi:hypothetical protein
MKMHTGTHTVEKSGDFEESKYSIEASAKAFFILSDGLYSNKILAVVRELSTNAYDSHVEAGKANVPFDVHIPTRLVPTFYIRDYGTGMSHENCMKLYTTYFLSTRNNSNDSVGCLGLGSKSPFAYADSFTVESFVDGERRIYNAYKDSNGNPVFSLMETLPTDEPNGIKVSLSVNEFDIYRFENEAANVYKFFNTKPNILGSKIDIHNPTKVISGDNWYYDAKSNNNLVIMGQIAYPIHSDKVGQPEDKVCKFLNDSTSLRIFVKIGDVDITPSRESLSYGKSTCETITNVVNSIYEEIKAKVVEEINSQPTLFKARLKYVELGNRCASIGAVIESLNKSITWNDVKLFDNMAGEYIEINKKLSVSSAEKSSYRSKIEVKKDIERIVFSPYYYKSIFFVDDLKRGGISRIRQAMKDKYNTGMNQYHYIYKLREGETAENCQLLTLMGDATTEDIVLTSSLEKVNYDRSSSGGGGPAIQARVFNPETAQFEICNMSVKYENAHYFAESRNIIDIGHRNSDENTLAHILNYIHENHEDMLGDAVFYLLKPSVVENRKIAFRDNWTKGETILTTIFNNIIDMNEDNIKIALTPTSLSKQNLNKWMPVLEKTSEYNLARETAVEFKEHTTKFNKIKDDILPIYEMSKLIPNVRSINIGQIKPDNRFIDIFDAEMSKYELLRFMSVPYNENDQKAIARYIDSVERDSQRVLASV